ncbi:hypothetical protein SDC9_181779 [bioreactor metagenome]|uniref:Uncharacterized protein n=1 Tax=bioreactor metagenome TaxID=1076179 RepID=A0A645H718_9ZZZZ
MLGRIVFAFIDAQNDGDVFVFGRGGDDNFLGAAFFNMDTGTGFAFGRIASGIGEETGGFDYDIHTQIFPGKGTGIFFGEDFDALAVDDQAVLGSFNSTGENAIVRIVLEQMSVCFSVKQIVDRNDFEFRTVAFKDRFQHLSADAAESVNTNLYCHKIILLDVLPKFYHVQTWIVLNYNDEFSSRRFSGPVFS